MESVGHGVRGVSCVLSIAAALGGCASEPEKPEPIGTVKEKVGQSLASEVEPNADALHATAIDNDGVVRGNIFPSGDVDYYRFTGQAGDRVYAATVTNFSVVGTDSVLGILGSDGTTVLEEDNDNGTFANGSSSTAGTLLPSTGTYYVRVAPSTPLVQIRPYDLHFRVRSGNPIAEVEPNDSRATAQPIGSGWVSGSISAAADLDLYSISLNAGDTLFASLDLDPERDGTSFDGAVALGAINGRFLNTNGAGEETGPDSEANFITVNASGTYYVLVAGASSGTYQLSTSVHPSAPNCTTYTSDAAVVIPDGPGFVTATLEVPDDVLIGDVNVSVRLNHASPPDLDVHLVAPSGNDVGLFSDFPTTFTTFDLTFDDEAALPLAAGGPYFSAVAGTVMQPKPNYRLHWFDGERARGTWTLKIWDDFAANGGSLASWGLSICAMPARPGCPSGTVATTLYGTDFETDDGGFTHSGTLDQWARGTPSGASAPITSCASGVNCFKTNLTGHYAASSSSELLSPSIDLSRARAPITIEWAQAYQLENAQFDHASVDVRRTDGTNPTRLFEFLDPTMQDNVGNPTTTVEESAGWGIRRADIGSYEGSSVELLFHQDSSPATQLSGFAIDDVSVVGCLPLCGNSRLDDGEQCDDGNQVDGDCCSAGCRFEVSGTSCRDSDPCNGAETCNDAGQCISGTPVVCTPSDECHVAGTCTSSSGCSNPPVPNGTACSNGSCRAGRCIADGMAGAGGESGAGGASGAGGESTGGRGGSAGTASAGEGGEGATSGNAGTSAGGNSGGTSAGRSSGGTNAGNNGGTNAGGAAGGTSEGGEAGDGTAGGSLKANADDSSGCGCSVVGRRARGWESLVLGALLLLLVLLRQSRSRNRSADARAFSA